MAYSIVPYEVLTDDERAAILGLCTRAYGEPFDDFLAGLEGAIHLLLYEDGRLASHVCWVDRLLQQEGQEPLRTAYIEAVATEPSLQRRGHATTLMQAAARLVQEYPLAALSPAETSLYARLGWLSWRGPLAVRTARGMEPAPEEQVLYLPTAATPAWLDPHAPLSCEWRAAPEQW